MNIVTKYDIGHRYWVARSIKRVHEEEQEINGKIWVRTYFTYDPIVKQKEIISIEARVNKDGVPNILYGARNVEDSLELSQWYSESQIENYTKEEAESIADEYAQSNEELYGVHEF